VEVLELMRSHGERDAESRETWLTALNGQVVTSDEGWDSVERDVHSRSTQVIGNYDIMGFEAFSHSFSVPEMYRCRKWLSVFSNIEYGE